ncbi:MAG TPA: carboxypeptidase M32 [Rubrobacteraceae bacterium]|jgi:carboxypeptidase Taq|nr:carboxypeptidase M32 [Rubrobacteraceae bacterium]
MTETHEENLRQLKERLAQISDVSSANGLLMWDRQTYMPKGGVAGRAEQTATLSRIAHEMLVDAETGRLLEALDQPDPSSEDGALVRRARREYEKATRLPGELVAEISRTTALAEPAWVEARERSDWSLFAPHLETILPLQREAAEHLGYEDHLYDALLDGYEPGAKKARLEKMFEELKTELVPLIRSISERDGEDREAPLHNAFDEKAQERFGEEVITRFGYDWDRGRQDRTVHPFCIGLTPGDVRITTRFDPGWLSPALFGTMHETGHALYEQGVDPAYARTPLSGGTSMGIHESQSRLWENLVGRSRPFWSHFYPGLQKAFPEALGEFELEGFYRAINAVSPSEIRVEADEVTYNLHILLRFELEVALIEGSLSVSDLPSAWNAKMEEYLGITPENEATGALQDVHWSAGLFGYFPTYTIGNVLSVALFDEAIGAYPAIPEQIAEGEFSTLLGWLRENIHRHGSRYYPDELIERVTGRPLDAAPYLKYLKNKFGQLYEAG